jgi:hypothetical protein
MIQAIVGTLIGPISELLSEFITDKDKANELAHKIATLSATQAHENALAQMEVNKTEAVHRSVFVAGWRPFIGWVCGLSMATNYMGVPLAGVFGFELPVLDITTMFPVLLGMLGLAGLRTQEKIKGVAREADPLRLPKQSR